MKKSLLAIFITIFCCDFLNSQTTITIPLSQGNGADTYLASGSPSTNYGSHPSLGGNTWTCTGNLCNSRGLFMFDLSSIPAGATITNASLELFADLNWSASPTTGGPDNTAYLSRVTTSWNENTVTWSSQPNITSTNQVLLPGSSTSAQNYTVGVTSLVQDMLTFGNYGFMLTMQDEVTYYKSLMFASSDNTVTSRCPLLKVSYTNNSVTTASITLCQGNGEDAYLASGSPSTNYGSHPSIGGNTWTCTGNLCNSRGLFKFDLTSIPSGATITNASLQLFADLNWSTSPTTGGPSNAGYLSRVTSAWSENSVTWDSQPTTTNSNQVTIPGSTSTAQNYTLNVTSLVQDMYANTNYGFMLKMQDEINYYKSLMFASSDNTNSATKCPMLIVSYTTLSGIGELNVKVNINIYPNPSSDFINVESDIDMKKIIISDLLGNIIIDKTVNNKKHTIDDKLANGLFIMSIYGQNNELLSSQKITKLN